MDALNPIQSPLVRRLQSITVLSIEEQVAIAALPMTVRDYKADADIVREGDHPHQCCLVLDGFLCR
jgi:CRP-like cAMP-binding protein